MPLYTCEERYTEELYYDFVKCFNRKMGVLRKNIILCFLLVIGFVTINVLYNDYIGAIVMVIGIPFFMLAIKLGSKRLMKKIWKTNIATQDLLYRVEFYNDYFRVVSENRDNRYYYDRLNCLLDSKLSVTLMYGANVGVLIDKRHVSDELNEFLRTKVKVIK